MKKIKKKREMYFYTRKNANIYYLGNFNAGPRFILDSWNLLHLFLHGKRNIEEEEKKNTPNNK